MNTILCMLDHRGRTVAAGRHVSVRFAEAPRSAISGRRAWSRVVCGLLMAVAGDCAARADDPAAALQQAVDEYRAALDCPDRDERLERFQRAQLMFAALVDRGEDPSAGGVRNASLHVNLGNAALGAEQLGPAVLAYRRALLLDPDHAQARQNLEHARSLLPEWVPRPESPALLDTFFSWIGHWSNAQRQQLAAWLFLACTLLIAASIRWQHRGLRALAWLPAIAWLLVVLTLLLARWQGDRDQGVVVADEVIARAADSPHAPPRFSQPLPGGTEVRMLEQREGWSRIQLADSREAWVPSSSVRQVAAP